MANNYAVDRYLIIFINSSGTVLKILIDIMYCIKKYKYMYSIPNQKLIDVL